MGSPKPSALRLLEGTDRHGRAGRHLDVSREPVAPTEPPTPPYEFAPDVLAEWNNMVRLLDLMNTASAADANQLAMYCESVIMYRKCVKELETGGLLQQGDRSMVANKHIAIQRDCIATIIKLAQEFGLTPSARTRVEVARRGREGDSNPFAG